MSLNIKDPEAHRLARALARETGVSMTAAVTQALRESLERRRRRRNVERITADLLAIGQRSARRLKGPIIEHGELLYDERGLPK